MYTFYTFAMTVLSVLRSNVCNDNSAVFVCSSANSNSVTTINTSFPLSHNQVIYRQCLLPTPSGV